MTFSALCGPVKVPHNPAMARWRALLALMVCLPLAEGAAALPAGASAAATPRLTGLTAEEAQALIAQLANLQRRLRAGEPVVFRLLSGAPASYPMTNVAPREAFLALRFQSAFSIERLRTDNRLRQPFKLTIVEGPNRPIWNVEVVLGLNGDVERVELLYEPAAPF